MRHICTAAITICIAVSLGVGFAQKDIPTDTFETLATEWKSSASNCLAALRLYTTYTPPGSNVPLSPEGAATVALNELLLGVLPPLDLASVTDLYKEAQKRADFLDKLAKANKRKPLELPRAQQDVLFQAAGDLIQAIYNTPPDGKHNLATVQASSAQNNTFLAIFQLLSAYPRSNPAGVATYDDNLEILRACFQVNAARLFNLVSDKILGTK